jgi:hypothetical protein
MAYTLAAAAHETGAAIESVLSLMEKRAVDDPAMIPAADEIGLVTAARLAELVAVAADDADEAIRAAAAKSGR